MGTFRVIIIVILFAVTTTTIWFHSSYAHLTNSEKIQVWTNPKDNVKIQFSYSPEMPIIDTFTSLNFSVQDLQSDDHIRDFTARVVVTNGERLFKFENITIPNGHFSVRYIFPDDGTHQVLLRLDTITDLKIPASFNVFVPHQSPPSILDPFPSSPGTSDDSVGIMTSKILAILLPAAAVTAIIIILIKKPKK
jgi:hypothetical protein